MSFRSYDDWKCNPYDDDRGHSDECRNDDCDGDCEAYFEDYDPELNEGRYNLYTGENLD